MHKSKAEKLRNLATKRQIITSADATHLGVPRTYLSRLARQGQLEKIAQGLYTSRAFSPSEYASLVEASYQVPKGIVCLLSALRFHSLTTQSPREVWIAVGHKAWAPKFRLSQFDSFACPVPRFSSERPTITYLAGASAFLPLLRPLPTALSSAQDRTRRRHRGSERVSTAQGGFH